LVSQSVDESFTFIFIAGNKAHVITLAMSLATGMANSRAGACAPPYPGAYLVIQNSAQNLLKYLVFTHKKNPIQRKGKGLGSLQIPSLVQRGHSCPWLPQMPPTSRSWLDHWTDYCAIVWGCVLLIIF